MQGHLDELRPLNLTYTEMIFDWALHKIAQTVHI